MSSAPGERPPGSNRIVCGICGILLGGLAVHKFILGMTSTGIIQIVITVVTCGAGSIIGLIEGIIYLTKTDQEFHEIYEVGKKAWF
jgi:TM2 domain-containing membrane protein YozV